MKKVISYASHSAIVGIFLSLIFSCSGGPAVTPGAFDAGLERMAELNQDTLPEVEYLVVVDFSQPSDKQRMQIHNLQTGKDEFYLVAHGAGNGGRFAERFSNEHGSHQSSLGLYRIGEEYSGRHGRSLYLFGLDSVLNANAYDRSIVFHSADYVSRWTVLKNRLTGEGARIGRSWGCFAVSRKEIDHLVDELQNNGYIYAWDDSISTNEH